MCGHATLAAATALFDTSPATTSITFETRWKGTLSVCETSDGTEMLLPATALNTLGKPPIERQRMTDIVANATEHALQPADIKCIERFEWCGDSYLIELAPSVRLADLRVAVKLFVSLTDL